jgi:hypothetical protein
MANSTVSEIQVSQSTIAGAVFRAPSGSTLPSNATTALNAAFKNLGHIGQEGITWAREVATEDVKDMNEDLLNAIFGDANVTVTAATVSSGRIVTFSDKGRVSEQAPIVIETVDGDSVKRTLVPVCQVTQVEEGPWVGSAVQQFTVTFSAYPDSSGNYSTTWDDDGEFSA